MKKLLFTVIIATTILSCSRDEKMNYSAIEQLVGTWSLQSKTINGEPVTNATERLYFYEDNDIRDFRGRYEFVSEESSSGVFALDLKFGNILFTSNADITTTYSFYINAITMVLSRTEDTGDVVSEIWVKNSNSTSL